jgi:phenylacetate-CoA ligase
VIFEPAFEQLPRERLRTLQEERLARTVRHVYDAVPFYRRMLDEAGIDPAAIRSLDDLPQLPFTHKKDLNAHYPMGMFAVPQPQLARIHASSGTTGKPTIVGYTSDDLELFATVNARALAAAGCEREMMLHNAYGYGLFTGGLGIHLGAERLGMTVIPVSGGMTERQLSLIADLRPHVLACTPSYALTLAQEFAIRGVEPEEISLRHAVLGAEPWTEAMRAAIDRGLGVRSANIFGLSEVIGPGVSAECAEERFGSHVNEDHFLPEIVDPTTGASLSAGESGVLVFTTLTKQALPLLRYWTGDVTNLSYEPCSCGRTLVRMGPIRGRTDDMLIVRGVNLYPSQIEDVLGRFEELAPHHQLVIERRSTLDELEVRVEVGETLFSTIGAEALSDDLVEAEHTMQSLRQRVSELIKETTGCTVRISLQPPGALPRSDGGKLKRVIDNRSLELNENKGGA